MSQEKNRRSKEFSSARDIFDNLEVDEKALFLMESTVKALFDGLQEAADTFSESMKDAFSRGQDYAPEEERAAEKAKKKKPEKKKTASRRTRKSGKSTRQAAPRKKATEKKVPDSE